jgi:hypothetical protein
MLEDSQGDMDESTFQIDEKEVKVEVMRSRGAGGQVSVTILGGTMYLVFPSTSIKQNQPCGSHISPVASQYRCRTLDLNTRTRRQHGGSFAPGFTTGNSTRRQ